MGRFRKRGNPIDNPLIRTTALPAAPDAAKAKLSLARPTVIVAYAA